MSAVIEEPERLSTVICDHVVRDEKTKKLMVAGILNTIGSDRLPHGHQRMIVLLSLANGQGKAKLAVKWVAGLAHADI